MPTRWFVAPLSAARCSVALAAIALSTTLARADVITQWTFNSSPPDTSSATGTFSPSTGSGTATLLPGTAHIPAGPFDGGSPNDSAADNSSWRTTNYPAQGQLSGQRGMEFAVSTAGFSAISIKWDQRHSNSSGRHVQLQYSLDGTNFTSAGLASNGIFVGDLGDTWFLDRTADLSPIVGVTDNPNFKFRIVQVFDPANPTVYTPSNGTATYGTSATGGYRVDLLTISGTAIAPAAPGVTNASVSPAALCNTGGTVVVSATISPGRVPTSTSLTVTASASNINGASSIPMVDNGLNGDLAAGDGIYSATITVSGPLTLGAKSIAVSVVDELTRSGAADASVSVVDCSTVSSSRIVISQVYGGGGNAGAIYDADFIELFNRSAQTIDLTGWSVQYASPNAATGFSNSADRVNLSGLIRPGQHLLVQYSAREGTATPLPTPDFIGIGGISNTGGRVALVRSAALLGTNCSDANVEDLVGWGTAICYEGAAAAGATSNATAILRTIESQDRNQNFADFSIGAPLPHNRAFGGFLAGFASSSNRSLCAGESVTLTVVPSPATSPASSSIAVSANLSNLGGGASVPVAFDSGSGNYILTHAIPTSVTEGLKTVVISTIDAQGRSDTTEVVIGVGNCAHAGGPVVVSMVFCGGGNTGAPFNTDFIEIFNRSAASVNLAGWSVQYAEFNSTFTGTQQVNLSGSIGPGEYRLIRCNALGASGGPTLTPDFIANPPFGMTTEDGRIAIVNSTTPLGSNCASPTIIDLFGYGAYIQCYEGVLPAAALPVTFGAVRKSNGCQDTDQTSIDFNIGELLIAPRNASSPANLCPQQNGACCNNTTCTFGTQAACTGTFQGPSTTCGPTPPTGNPTTCCPANFNATGGVTVADIFAFLTAWFAGNPSANFNGTGGITVADIFAFLTAWFAGCP